MSRRLSIEVDGVLVNPHVPEAAQLLVDAYRFWSVRESLRWKPPHVSKALQWDGVQLWLAARKLAPRDLPDPTDALSSVLGNRASTGEVELGRLVIAVIPGTNEPADWTANLNPIPAKVGGLPGRWRRGFVPGAEFIAAEIRRFYREGDRILLVGHSYGAAMALVAAALLARDGFWTDVLGVLAFAAPRVTSKCGAAFLSEAYPGVVGQRIVLGFDVVPWSVLPVGWRHALDPVFVGSDGRVRRSYRFRAELWNALRRRGVQAIGQHGMGNYAAWARDLPEASK